MTRREVYAADTKVPIEKTRMELEQLLSKHKARATAVFNQPNGAAVAFEMQDRRVLFKMQLPEVPGGSRAYEKVMRQRREKWRALFLSIKAKLVSVQSGIETFEDAFLAHVVMPDGQTVGEHSKKQIESAYKSGKMVPLLPGPSQ